MNTALAILAHALRMLVFETGTTLRVLMPAILIVLGCALGIALFAQDTVALMQDPEGAGTLPAPSSVLSSFLFGLVGLLGYAFMAVLWHRHVLLNGAEHKEETRPSPSIFWGYIWRAIIVGAVQLCAAIPITLAMGIMGTPFDLSNSASLPATFIGLLGSIVFIYIALRLSIVLPAAAIGHIVPVKRSWEISRPVSNHLWGLALLLTGLNMCVYAIAGLLLPDAPLLNTLAQTLIFIVEGLVFVSVLTTLYGHLVEGRSLGQDRPQE